MVVINYKGGQLANRIVLFAHFIVNAIEHKHALVNPEFDEYTPYFEGPATGNFQGYPITLGHYRHHKINRAYSRIVRLWADITYRWMPETPWYRIVRIFKSHDKRELIYDLNQPDFIASAKTKTVIAEGWLFKDRAHIEKHGDVLRQIFTPVEPYRSQAEEAIAEARKEVDVLIGVHIRRGDYARFWGGKWYYEDDVYEAKMLALQDYYATQGKRCGFFVCTNETLHRSNYDSSLRIYADRRHFIVDLHALSRCDGIIGPPSTFSIWASFYGKKPLTQLETAETSPLLGEYRSIL